MEENNVEKFQTVGLLVVHGMGEQQPRSHRNAVAESLVRAWQEKYKRWNVREERDSTDEREACVTVLINTGRDDGTLTKVEVREVYWANADESPQGLGQSILFQLKFWCWGLSQWVVSRFSKADTGLPGSDKMDEPVPEGESRIPFSVRLRLFGVGVAFALLGVTWELLRLLLRLLRVRIRGSGVLVRSLGDVQLYTENRYRYRPADFVTITDAPRDAIRRRMVKGLVQMALKRYDRWYVVAHSLGSVVAHNGLMELGETLPNYLTKGEWKQVRRHDEKRRKHLATVGPDVTGREMRPARPDWLENTDAIDRGVLFERLKGFCTYGSPLDKFATLWPGIVPINTDAKPLSKCKWINVHDLMDPVGAELDRFGAASEKGFKPTNMPYRASVLFILAHIAYLNRPCADGLAARLGEWVVTGKAFDTQVSGKFGGGVIRRAARYVWWFGLSGIAAYPLILFVGKLCENCAQSAFDSLKTFMSSMGKAFWHATDLFAVLCVLGAVMLLMIAIALLPGRKQEP